MTIRRGRHDGDVNNCVVEGKTTMAQQETVIRPQLRRWRGVGDATIYDDDGAGEERRGEVRIGRFDDSVSNGEKRARTSWD